MEKSYRAELVGVFGYPVDGNTTIVMEEAAFKALDLNYRYITYKVMHEDLEAAIKALTALNMRGINLTAPHKVEVLKYLDSISKEAEIIGAANTIVVENQKLHGENTDGKGFLKSLNDIGIDVSEKNVDILGAGGAARAIAVEIALAGASRVNIINRREDRGSVLSELINDKTSSLSHYRKWEASYRIPDDTDMLINCTTIGMLPHPEEKPDIDYSCIRKDMIVCDAVANPPNTLFLSEAAKQGARIVDGLGMMINQGAVNFTLWTGEKAPLKVMTEAIKREYSL